MSLIQGRLPALALRLPQRFWDKIVKSTGCWIWEGSLDQDGYGRFMLDGRNRRAHVLTWEAEYGPVPDGKQLDHLCRVRRCVRPSHLEPVTRRENILRGEGQSAVNARKTHCIHGHALTPGNLVLSNLRQGKRRCRTCKMDEQRRRRQSRRSRSA